MVQDFVQAVRSVRRRPGLAAAVVLTLALAIGANTVIFSLVHGILLAPLPYPSPERVVAVWPELWLSKGMFERLAEEATAFEALAAYSGGAAVLVEGGDPTLLFGPSVTAGFFRVLGTSPAAGVLFSEGDDRAGAEAVVLITEELWHERFGSDPGVVGEGLKFEGGPRTVLGVLPAGLELLQEDAEIVQPLVLDPASDDYHKAQYLKVVGRLRDGVTVGEAAAEARAIAARWAPERDWSEETVRQAAVVPLREHLVRDSRPLLLVLTGAVSLLLIVATANVVHLLLAGRLARGRELAVRTALGATSARVARLFVTESLLLGLAGGAGGLLVASLLVPGIVRLAPFDLPRLASVEVGPTAIGFGLLLGVVTAAVGGLVPALVQRPVGRSLREEGRGATGSVGSDRLRRALVAAEVALSLVVLLGAALLVKSFWHLTRVDPGFDARNVFSATLLPPGEATAGGAGSTLAFYERLTERVEGLAGVESAALVQTLPITGGGWVMETLAEGVERVGEEPELSYWRVVSPGYLETLGARLLRGRPLGEGDRAGAAQVAVVNQSFAELFWPGGEVVGRRFRMPFEDDAGWIRVVGVIADTRHLGLDREPVPTAYRPHAQALDTLVGVGNTQQALVVRTRAEPAAVGPAVLRALREAEPALAVADPATMEQRLSSSLTEPRVTAVALVLFAATAVVLAVIGLVGIVSRSVAERAPEIALRRVLGAEGRELLRLVLTRSLLPVAVGLMVGVGAGLAAARTLGGLLFEVRPSDPWALAVAVGVLGAAALLAAYLPARRAARIEPASVLE